MLLSYFTLYSLNRSILSICLFSCSSSSSSSDSTTSNSDSDSDSGGGGGLLGGLGGGGGGGLPLPGFLNAEFFGILTLGLVILYFAGLFLFTPILVSTLTDGLSGKEAAEPLTQ